MPCQMSISNRGLLNRARERGERGGEFPNDCKKATGTELSIFLLPRQICLHIFLLCLRSLLRQRMAIEIFWQAALCFHFHKRCSEGAKGRKSEREICWVGKVKGCCQRLEGHLKRRTSTRVYVEYEDSLLGSGMKAKKKQNWGIGEEEKGDLEELVEDWESKGK